jgi:hypothetical protein
MSTYQQFWGSPEKWPADSASYVFLARAISVLGKSVFGNEWTDNECVAEHFNLNRALADDLYLNNFLAKHAPNSRREHFDPPTSSLPIIDASGTVVNFDRPLPNFSISENDLIVAVSLAEQLKAQTTEAIERFKRVKNDFARLAESEELLTAYRSIDGGEQAVIPRVWWNTEIIQNRFANCQIDPTSPFNNQVQGSAWIYVSRASLERLVSREPPLDMVKDRSEAKRGRRKGTGSFEKLDRPILDEMRTMLLSGKFASPEEAARKFANKAHGNGTIESKAERLARRYRSTFE